MLELTSNPDKRKRKSVSKSRRGCITCKIRHIRCDEEKPSCSKCLKSGRQCDGYSFTGRRPDQDPLQIIQWQPNTLTLHRLSVDVAGDQEERRSFHFFRECAAGQLAGYFDSSFWRQLVLQASHTDASIRHAVIALGSLHKTVRRDKGTQVRDLKACDPFALQQCNKAIAHLNQSICLKERVSKEMLLMSCAIFICFESLQGNYESALSHMLGGVRIFRDWRANTSPSRGHEIARSNQHHESVDKEIVQIFSRLNMQILLFPDTHLFPTDFVRQDVQVIIDSVPAMFTTLKEARDCLDDCMNYGLQTLVAAYFTGFESKAGSTTGERHNHTRDYLLPQWAAAFEILSNTPSPIPRLEDIHAAAVLEIQYLCASILLSVGFPPRETAFDKFRASFEKIISLAASVICHSSFGGVSDNASSFSFETGVVPPLYLTATRCRDSKLRRRALSLLSARNRQEGIWNSVMLSKLAERFILLEEQSHSFGQTTNRDLQEASRLTVLNATIVSERRQVLMECCHQKEGANEKMRIVDECIDY